MKKQSVRRPTEAEVNAWYEQQKRKEAQAQGWEKEQEGEDKNAGPSGPRLDPAGPLDPQGDENLNYSNNTAGSPLSQENSSGEEEKNYTSPRRSKQTAKPREAKGQPNTKQILEVDRILATLPALKFFEDKFYLYSDVTGCWAETIEGVIGNMVQKALALQGKENAYAITSMLKLIKWRSVDTEGFYQANRHDSLWKENVKTTDILLNCLNGVVRINAVTRVDDLADVKGDLIQVMRPVGTHTLEPHDPQFRFSKALQVVYDKSFECPLMRAEIKEKLPDDLDKKMELLKAAYCLLPDNRLNVAFLNHGETNTGKSTIWYHGFASVFEGLVSNLDLAQLCPVGPTSFIGRLKNSLVNLAPEIDVTKNMGDTANLKKLITGESIVTREVYSKGGEFSNTAKFIFNINEFPKFNGTDAEIKRIRVTHYGMQTLDAEIDIGLDSRLDGERCGIFMWILEQFSELLQLKQFPHGSVRSVEIENMLYNTINPLGHFVRDNCVVGHTHWMFSYQLDLALGSFLQEHYKGTKFEVDKFHRDLVLRYGLLAGEERKWEPNQFGKRRLRSVIKGIKLRKEIVERIKPMVQAEAQVVGRRRWN
jgi:hypothetical protein